MHQLLSESRSSIALPLQPALGIDCLTPRLLPPSLQVYNLILRRYPLKEYEAFRSGGNLFPTTIAALASAVTKIARVTKLPPGLLLYRGLGGLMDMPEAFFKADDNGCRGYTEYGFMSSTSNKETALQYSGAKENRPKPTVSPPHPTPCLQMFLHPFPAPTAPSATPSFVLTSDLSLLGDEFPLCPASPSTALLWTSSSSSNSPPCTNTHDSNKAHAARPRAHMAGAGD